MLRKFNEKNPRRPYSLISYNNWSLNGSRQVKIREVMFEYKSKVQKTTLNLAADNFVEVFLENALLGKTNYVPKY